MKTSELTRLWVKAGFRVTVTGINACGLTFSLRLCEATPQSAQSERKRE